MTLAMKPSKRARSISTIGALGVLLASVALTGCPQESEERAVATPASSEQPSAAAPAAHAEPAAPAVEAFESHEAILTAAAGGVRREPTMDRHVDQGSGRVANWLLSLYRGDRVTVTRIEEHGGEKWAWVKPAGDQEGWLKDEWLMPAAEGTAASSAEELRVFELPDPTRPQRGQSIAAGTYLLVLATDGDFSRVNHVGQRSAWVRSRDLTTAEDEVGVSRVISRVRWMKSRNEAEGVEDLLEGTKEAFPGASLLSVLAEEARPQAE